MLTFQNFKVSNEVFTFFFVLSLEICGLYIHCTSQFGLATFQVLTSHMWLTALILGRIGIENQSSLPHSEVDSLNDDPSHFIFELGFCPKWL